jgi:hypothetical protein
MRHAILIMLIVSGLASRIWAQNSLSPNIYFQDMNYYNPSSLPADTSGNYFISAYTKYKFVENDHSIWKKPPSVFVNHIGRLRDKRSFYSIAYLNDSYSYFNRNGLYLGYIHKLQLGSAGSLSFSGRAVINVDVIRWSRYQLPLPERINALQMRPDADLGIEYKLRGLTLGAASQNVLASSVSSGNAVLIKNKRAWVFNASCLFNIGPHVQLAPFSLIRRERNWMFDAGVYVSALKRIRASYALRVKELRHIYTIDCRATKRLFLGLSFDHSRLLPDNNLDVALKYQF